MFKLCAIKRKTLDGYAGDATVLHVRITFRYISSQDRTGQHRLLISMRKYSCSVQGCSAVAAFGGCCSAWRLNLFSEDRRLIGGWLALPACCATATAGLTVTGQGENWQAGRQAAGQD